MKSNLINSEQCFDTSIHIYIYNSINIIENDDDSDDSGDNSYNDDDGDDAGGDGNAG